MKPPKLISVGVEFPDADISMTTTEHSESSDFDTSTSSLGSDEYGIGFGAKSDFEDRVLPHQAWLEKTKKFIGMEKKWDEAAALNKRVDEGVKSRNEWYGKVEDSIAIAKSKKSNKNDEGGNEHLVWLDRVRGAMDNTYERKFSEFEPKFGADDNNDDNNDVHHPENGEPPHMNFLKKAGKLLNEDLTLVASVNTTDTANTAVNFSPNTSYGGNLTSMSISMSRSYGGSKREGGIDSFEEEEDDSADISTETETTMRKKGTTHGPPKSWYDGRVKSSISLSQSIDMKRSGRNLGRGKRGETGEFAKLYESARSLSSSDSSSSGSDEDSAGEGEMQKLKIPLY